MINKSKLYIFYTGTSFLSILIGEIVSSTLYEVLEIGIWAVAITVGITIYLKAFTSLRFFPLFTGLRISETHIRKVVLGYEARVLLKNNTYIYLKRFHGVTYVIFSSVSISDVRWANIAKKQNIIIYPKCAGMSEDFSEIFMKAIVL